MSRKRTLALPDEMIVEQRLSTKKELAENGRLKSCPAPSKISRKNLRKSFNQVKEPAPLCFNIKVSLSSIYDPKQEGSYLDQVYSRYGFIGEGSFGYVYKVQSKEDGQFYAVKTIKPNVSLKDKYAEVKNNEILGYNPNCVQYFMSWEENNVTYMLLEYCDMSLEDYSKLNNDIPEELLWNVLYDMCKALEFLHNRNFLHLDVKPGNIMMKKGVYKLGDFGLLVHNGDKVKISSLSEGDAKYVAAEVLNGIYTTACDVFGLGISILELAGDIDLPANGSAWRDIRNKCLPSWFYDRKSRTLTGIVEGMLSVEYEERPSVQEILMYPGVKLVAQRDLQLLRTDFAVSYIKSNDLSSIQLNNNNDPQTTPPNKRIPFDSYYSDKDSGLHRWSEKRSNLNGRNLFMSDISDFDDSQIQIKADESFLASPLHDSTLDFLEGESFSLNVSTIPKKDSSELGTPVRKPKSSEKSSEM